MEDEPLTDSVGFGKQNLQLVVQSPPLLTVDQLLLSVSV